MAPGVVDVVGGCVYGDEGKGKKVDREIASGKYGVAGRYNGAHNAGHTLITPSGEILVVNAIPSGVLTPDVMNYIGSGCVVDPVHLIRKEIPKIEKHVDLTGRLKISANTTAITPVHILMDGIFGGTIGTTNNGIGPAYTSRAMRAEGDLLHNLRMGDILDDPDRAIEIVNRHFQNFSKRMKDNGVELGLLNIPSKIVEFVKCALELEARGFIERDPNWLIREVKRGVNVLMEGAQAYRLDVAVGDVPFVTSSSPLPANAFVGGDVPARYRGQVFGVSKLVPSRVGGGPFVGEYGGQRSEEYCAAKDEQGKTKYTREYEKANYDLKELMKSSDPFLVGIAVRMLNGGYGATTGRPRRKGMFDLAALVQAIECMGVDSLTLNRFDSLEIFRDIRLFEGKMPVIVGYEIDGQRLNYIPSTVKKLRKVEPIVQLIDVPTIGKHHAFVEMIQKATGVRVTELGTGPGRDDMYDLAA